ncbi:MAG: response regulator with CheY-like receiver domain and winged-helix DNA-binding domain [Magnetococcales bacterium]|nr:response regulator with CheY-like receiver domain and winged-helix DNA-binding domain [Magnetococcales bacterium]HIJ84902.1 response regulator [Magnetococcales bacterium]
MTEVQKNVVLIEDEKMIRRYVALALTASGFKVWESETAQQGLLETASRRPDLIILDLGLPDRDGVDVIREMRLWCEIPILVLSVRTDEGQKVEALDAGADDYLTKPFGVPELQARIRAVLRRRSRQDSDPEFEKGVFAFGDIQVDMVHRRVNRSGQPIHLTPIEYQILTLLVANVDRVLTHRFILQKVWGPDYVNRPHYLRVFMAGLRRKIEENSSNPKHLMTETGIGYRLVRQP